MTRRRTGAVTVLRIARQAKPGDKGTTRGRRAGGAWRARPSPWLTRACRCRSVVCLSCRRAPLARQCAGRIAERRVLRMPHALTQTMNSRTRSGREMCAIIRRPTCRTNGSRVLGDCTASSRVQPQPAPAAVSASSLGSLSGRVGQLLEPERARATRNDACARRRSRRALCQTPGAPNPSSQAQLPLCRPACLLLLPRPPRCMRSLIPDEPRAKRWNLAEGSVGSRRCPL